MRCDALLPTFEMHSNVTSMLMPRRFHLCCWVCSQIASGADVTLANNSGETIRDMCDGEFLQAIGLSL
jgi:hypothetical protein